MGLVLYRKYRPRTLADVIGQEHITRTIDSALARGQSAHAYLLTGPRGTGKTSVARILAYRLNEVDYQDEGNHLDIVEIDAASNRRIDEMRSLRDSINVAPTEYKYRVYIIDEVHMLTTEAFNALLKTLEEPPAHAIFILATTEFHKIPETIVSRCQRFSFHHIDRSKISKRIKQICKLEGITIDQESIELISKHARGSFRDGLSLLDQLSSLGASKINAQLTRDVLGILPETGIDQIIEAWRGGQISEIVACYRSVIDDGVDPGILSAQLATRLREGLENSSNRTADLQLVRQLLDIGSSRYPETMLEVILLETAQPTTPSTPTEPKPATPALKKTPKNKHNLNVKPKPKQTDQASESIHKVASNDEFKQLREKDWPKILEHIKADKNTLYSILRMARHSLENQVLKLEFAFAFHAKRAADSSNQNLIKQAIHDLGYQIEGVAIEHNRQLSPEAIESHTEQEATPPKLQDSDQSASASNSGVPEAIMNVFQGAEVID